MPLPVPGAFGEVASFEQYVASLSEEDQELVLSGIDFDDLKWDWRWSARPQQYLDPADESWAVTLAMAGRGAGKTKMSTEWIRRMDQEWSSLPWRHGVTGDGTLRIALLSRTAADVRDTLITGPSGLLNIYPPSLQDKVEWTSSLRRVTLPGGAICTTFCADPKTEVLTRTGWKNHTDLVVGEDVMSLNTETRQAEWTPLEAVHTFDVVDEDMVSLEMTNHSSLTTMGHRWPTENYETKALRWRTSLDEFNSKDTIIAAAPASDIPETSKHSTDLAALMGWYTAEGHLDTRRPRHMGVIVQSLCVNPDKVDEIAEILTRLFGLPVDTLRGERKPAWLVTKELVGNGCVHFRLNHEAVGLLEEHAPGKDKVVSLEFVNDLTREGLAAFVEAYVSADGHRRGKSYEITQTVPERLASLEFAALRLGYGAHRRPIVFSPKSGALVGRMFPMEQLSITWGQNARPRPVTAHGVDHRRHVTYTGVVWCPQTKNKTWLAKRAGTVYFTGNSAEEPDQIRGPEFHIALADELAAHKGKPGADGLIAWDNLRIATRMGRSPQIMAATTPKRTPVMRKLMKEANDPKNKIRVRKMRTFDNPYLSETYLNLMDSLYMGTSIGAQELDGEMLEDVIGALMKPVTIDAKRVTEIPSGFHGDKWLRIIGVDPSVSDTPTDECGIILAGCPNIPEFHKRHAFIVSDESMIASPATWARRVAYLADLHDAVVVVESNQGGAMCELVVTQAAREMDIPVPKIRQVWASGSKKTRAEPVGTAYERGRVHHVNVLPELESQLTEWVEGESGYSPDRMDALVWAVTPMLFPKVLKGNGLPSHARITGANSFRPSLGLSAVSASVRRQGRR